MSEYQLLLSFTQSILSEMRICSKLLSSPFHWDEHFDNELRKSIYKESEYLAFCRNVSDMFGYIYEEFILSRYTDRFGCEYIFLRIPNTDAPTLFIAGPFTYVPFTVMRAVDYCQRAELPESFQDFMQRYYVSLPVIPDEYWMESLMGTLTRFLWGEQKLSMPHITLDSGQEKFIINPDLQITSTPSAAAYIDSIYEVEDRLCSYISSGNLEKIEEVRKHMSLNSVKQHFPGSIRDQKNNLIMFNTISRKAAQYGGVHPIYIDTEANKLTARIECAVSIKELDSIFHEIPWKYCMLVRNYSLKGYSLIIQKVIIHISLNLDSDLRLQKIAEQFSLNKNYLSAFFKKEMGISLTSFVNQERINHAVQLLNITQFKIEKIAKLCGVEDVNYFSRLFKKQVGMSPSVYRKNIR